MTEKQKEAIILLNQLANGEVSGLNKEDYFLLLEFVLQEKSIEWIPYYPQTIPPIQPYYTTTQGQTIK